MSKSALTTKLTTKLCRRRRGRSRKRPAIGDVLRSPMCLWNGQFISRSCDRLSAVRVPTLRALS